MTVDEYALSPIQEGMLFHHLARDIPGVDIEQIVIGYDEVLDTGLLERAWRLAVERHPALRTSFEWKQHAFPVQQVHDRVDLRLEVRAGADNEDEFWEFLARDRALGFDLALAPLMRLTLFEYGQHCYRLVWTVHHILLDGRAFILVLNDVEEFYQRLRRGESVIAEPGPPFHQYIDWLQSLDLEGASQFWADRLRGLAGPTPLLEDKHASNGSSSGHGEEEVRLSKEVTTGLHKVAKRYGITLNTIVMGVWGLLLSRYCGEQEVLFGATKTTRRGSISGADAVAGLFLNTIPVRANLSPEASVASALLEIRTEWLSLRAFEHTPLTTIKDASGFTPSASLFDSLVVFENQNFQTALAATADCWNKREWHLLEQNGFPLTFAVYGDPAMLLKLEFDRRKFTNETAQRILRHVQNLFEGIAANPEQKIWELTMLSPAERQQMLEGWNYPRQVFTKQCVHQMFEEQARRTPDSVALVFENQRMTYRELNARANQLANYLRRLGVGPEDLVGLYTERSLDLVVGLIGILKAGGAYLPIDTVYPRDRIGFMLEDASVRILLTQEPLLASLPESQARMVCLDTEWGTIEQESPENLSLNICPDNLTYVIYTSGSTGKPKGCQVTHNNVTRLMLATDPWFHFDASDVWTLFHSHAFDFSVWEIWGALLFGGRLVVVPYGISRDSDQFLQLLAEQRVTVLNQTPSAFLQLIQADELALGTDLALRLVIFGGEALELQSLRPWFNMHSDQRPQLVNMYGITETTVHVTYRPLSFEDVQEGHGSMIGRPIPDLSLYILDPQLEPTPIGVPGEMFVGGAGVARGYLNRPELTQTRFVGNPFSTQSGDCLYRSGDLARRLANGDIEYLGRIDQQVKIRGFRIELGEIEAELRAQPEIEAAVVISRENTPGDKRLVAYLVTSPGMSRATSEVRKQLRERLPDYMVPSAFVFLDQLPISPNGKIDRKALSAPETAADETGKEQHAAPRTLVEQLLAGIWADVLHRHPIGIRDNFFDIGGHSLTAMQVTVRIRNIFDLDLPVSYLFQNPMIELLAVAIEEKCASMRIEEKSLDTRLEESSSSQNRTVPIERNMTGVQIASFGQERIWLLEQIDCGAALYNICYALHLKGSLNVTALKSALCALVQRHETLRTRFIDVEGRLHLEVPTMPEVPLPIADFSGMDKSGREDILSAALHAEANRPIVLARELAIRTVLYCMNECEHVLQLTFHHAALDGWSAGVIFHDIAAFYNASVMGTSANLPELPISYSDFARWQREQLAGIERERLISYWKEQLQSSSFALQLPTDRPRPPLQTFSGAVRRYKLAASLATAIQEFCHRESVTPFMVTLAALYVVLARYSGQNDILIGSPITARPRIETEELVGFFANTVILRGNLEGNPTFRELLQQVRQTALNAYAHQGLPLELLIDRISQQRDLSRSALFQVMLVFQNTPQQRVELNGLEISIQEVRTDTSKFDFTVELSPAGETIEAIIEYNTDLFDAGAIDRLWGHLDTYLFNAVASPELKVETISMLVPAERQQMLVEWNATEREYPRETPLAELVEAQVERNPDAIAVVYGKQHITYRRLNERANQLAHELRKHGAGPDQLIGLCVERSTDMVVALLAIVKTGAAYLPLDPLMPAERRRFMLEDSCVRVVVTEQNLREELPAFTGATILLEDAGWQANQRDNLAVAVRPEDLAFVIFTSGSTGKPKGVQIPRKALTNLLWSMREWLQLSEKDRLLAVTTISFDIAGADVWLPLLVGAQTVLASRENAADGNALRDLLERHDITFLQATPVTWQLLFDSGWGGKPDLQTVCTGEAMPPEIAAQLVPVVKRVWNLYGPTETTIWSTGYRVTDGREPILIGHPIANTQCYILDSLGQPVPVAVTGELYIGGDGLALGYLNRPELTAEKFVTDPFRGGNARMFRTGDLVRYRADGNIECLGRADYQVKIRGYRIELGEIETALKEHPEINQAVVVAREDKPGDKRLVAYYTTSHIGEVELDALSPEKLRKHLSAILPEYMVPAAYVHLESLPLTPNGKLDRRAMPPPGDEANATRQYEPPEGAIEAKLAAIWADVLKLNRVGRHDNFFELGGNSFQAVRVLVKIRATFPEYQPSLTVLMKAQTVERLACTLLDRQADRTCLVTVRAGSGRAPFFCVHGAGGNVVSMRSLAMALPPEQPFYSFQARGLDGYSAPFSSVEETAECYVNQIRRVQPHGPYFLGGWSYGGLVAFEMAHRLESIGESVGILAMLDTSNLAYTRLLPRSKLLYLYFRYIVRRAIYHFKILGWMKPQGWSKYFSIRIRIFLRMARNMARIAAEGNQNSILLKSQPDQYRAVFGPGDLREALDRVMDADSLAAQNFIPKPYHGHLLLFRADTRNEGPYVDRTLGWRNVALGGVKVYKVIGDHESIFQYPNVVEIANILDRELREAQRM